MELSDELERVPEGDPVCWLERVCAECGALVETQLPAACWRCGVEVTAV